MAGGASTLSWPRRILRSQITAGQSVAGDAAPPAAPSAAAAAASRNRRSPSSRPVSSMAITAAIKDGEMS